MDIAVLLLVFAALLGAVLVARSRRRVTPMPPLPAAEDVEPPAPPSQEPVAEPLEPLAVVLQRLDAALEPRAEKSAHPQEMIGWPEFEAVVAVFRRPDVSLAT